MSKPISQTYVITKVMLTQTLNMQTYLDSNHKGAKSRNSDVNNLYKCMNVVQICMNETFKLRKSLSQKYLIFGIILGVPGILFY